MRIRARSTASLQTAISMMVLVCLPFPAALAVRLAAQTSPRSIVGQARELAQTGETKQAEELLSSFLSSHPDDLGARVALADIYAKNGESERAEDELRRVLKLHPGSSLAVTALAALYMSQSRFESAEQVLADSLEHHPKLPAIQEQLATALAAEHKYQEAARQIVNVPPPRDPPSRVRYFRLSASIQSGLGDPHRAAEEMEAALAAMPGDRELRWLTALAEAEAAEWSACIRHVSSLFTERPEPETGILELRAQLSGHQDFTLTLDKLRQLNLPDRKRWDLRVNSAELLASAGKHLEAAEEFEQALKISHERAPMLVYNLAVEQYASGQYPQALATLGGLREQNDSAEIEDLAGDIDEQSGNFSAAIHDHETAVVLDPAEERYRLSLGAVLLENGDYRGAAQAFEKSVALFPNSARTYVGLGMADYLMEQNEESVSAFIHADRLNGGSGRILTYLGATQSDSAAGPSPTAVNFICTRAHSDPADSSAVTWCAALLFRKAYVTGDVRAADDMIPQLKAVIKLAPDDPVGNCSLGAALQWTQQFREARHFLENCVRLEPDSVEDRYRLSQVYRSLGLLHLADEQAALLSKINRERDAMGALARKVARELALSSRKP